MIGLAWMIITGLVYFLLDRLVGLIFKAGVGFVAYTAIDLIYDQALAELVTMLNKLNASDIGQTMVDSLYLMNIDTGMTIILSASFARFVMNVGMTADGKAYKTAIKGS